MNVHSPFQKSMSALVSLSMLAMPVTALGDELQGLPSEGAPADSASKAEEAPASSPSPNPESAQGGEEADAVPEEAAQASAQSDVTPEEPSTKGTMASGSEGLQFKLVHVTGGGSMAGKAFKVGDARSGVMCDAPCDVRLGFRDGEYGELAFETPVANFKNGWLLHGTDPDFDVRLEGVEEREGRGLGLGFSIAGGVVFAGGAAVLIAAAAGWHESHDGCSNGDCRTMNKGLAATGIAGMAVGAAGLTFGLVRYFSDAGKTILSTRTLSKGGSDDGLPSTPANPSEAAPDGSKALDSLSFMFVPVNGGAAAMAEGRF